MLAWGNQFLSVWRERERERETLQYSKRRTNNVLQLSGRLTHVFCQVKSPLSRSSAGRTCMGMGKLRFLISNGEQEDGKEGRKEGRKGGKR